MVNPYLQEVYVSASIIRDAFNSGQFWERAQLGEFNIVVKYDNPYSPQDARNFGFDEGARSQILEYRDEIGQVAVVHQIRNPDGTLGASGRPDPKYLRLDNRILRVRTMR